MTAHIRKAAPLEEQCRCIRERLQKIGPMTQDGQERVDLLVPKLMKALKKTGLENVPVIVGGIVPDEDEKKLKKAGVKHVFHPGASREEIVSGVAALAAESRAAKEKEMLV